LLALPYVQQAALLCKDERFIEWIGALTRGAMHAG